MGFELRVWVPKFMDLMCWGTLASAANAEGSLLEILQLCGICRMRGPKRGLKSSPLKPHAKLLPPNRKANMGKSDTVTCWWICGGTGTLAWCWGDSNMVYAFPVAALTKNKILSGLKQQKPAVSKFWRSEFQNQCTNSEALGENLSHYIWHSCKPRLSPGIWDLLTIFGGSLTCTYITLISIFIFTWHSLCGVCLCPNFPLFKWLPNDLS